MTNPSASGVRKQLKRDARDRIVQIDIFSTIDSTNSFLMQSAAPAPGQVCIAATTNQTAGRGQRGRTWVSPPGSGIALSLAHTYAVQPENLAALTLAIGISAIEALEEIGASGVQLKWPNDLVANGGKLAGILTEAQQQSTGALTVVTGIGVNIDLPDAMPVDEGIEWASHIADLTGLIGEPPELERLLAALINRIVDAFVLFEVSGFASFKERWHASDWLVNRPVVVDAGEERVQGIASGVAEDGSLLVATEKSGMRLVASGSIVRVGEPGQLS